MPMVETELLKSLNQDAQKKYKILESALEEVRACKDRQNEDPGGFHRAEMTAEHALLDFRIAGGILAIELNRVVAKAERDADQS